MKEYFTEEEYVEDIYGDEIKVGEKFYRVNIGFFKIDGLVHEKNFIQFSEDELDVKKEER